MKPGQVSVSRVAAGTIPVLLALMGTIEAERLPADPQAAERARAEIRLSLSRFDMTHSDACTVLMAAVEDAAAGYAVAIRIPKLDARIGFLYVDELYVLAAYRRAGVARALLHACESVAHEWGLHAVRLLVRPENTAARELYCNTGFAESTTNFCEKILT